jgi:hypothetical protein
VNGAFEAGAASVITSAGGLARSILVDGGLKAAANNASLIQIDVGMTGFLDMNTKSGVTTAGIHVYANDSVATANVGLQIDDITGANRNIAILTGVGHWKKDSVIGSIVCSNGSLATNAADGFLHIPSTQGIPTTEPNHFLGTAPLVFDTTNDRLYAWNGSWKSTMVSGATVILSDASIDNLRVGSVFSVGAAGRFDSTLSVGGATRLDSTLSVGGNSVLGGTLTTSALKVGASTTTFGSGPLYNFVFGIAENSTGTGVLAIGEVTTTPSSLSFTNGGKLFVRGGALCFMGQNGSLTTVAPS